MLQLRKKKIDRELMFIRVIYAVKNILHVRITSF